MALFLTSSVSGDGMIIAGSFFLYFWMLKLISEAKITDRQMLGQRSDDGVLILDETNHTWY